MCLHVNALVMNRVFKTQMIFHKHVKTQYAEMIYIELLIKYADVYFNKNTRIKCTGYYKYFCSGRTMCVVVEMN